MLYERSQLPLPFPHHPGYEALDFLSSPSNEAALAWLGAEWPDFRLALFGPAGCGKSHLLHIWAKQTAAVVLPGKTLNNLDAIPLFGGLAVDDADTVMDEVLLLHVLNTARDRGLSLLLSGREPPARWPVRLPDLFSRLRAITAVEICHPNDELLAALLMRLLSDRQLVVPPPVQKWLLNHLPRSAAAMREVVVRLDRASLASGSPITRSLAQQILAEQDFAVTDADELSMSAVDLSSDHPTFL